MRPALRLRLVALALTAGVGGAAEAQSGDLSEAMRVVRLASPLPAPDVTFRTLDGQNVRLADLKGRPVLLGFFTTW
ncbi:MAG: peroxiredoxin family protein [Candidatus Rokuibacteriota bacterium]